MQGFYARAPVFVRITHRIARDFLKNTNTKLYALIFWLRVKLLSLVFYINSSYDSNEQPALRTTDDNYKIVMVM